jgi:hypothetical protein
MPHLNGWKLAGVSCGDGEGVERVGVQGVKKIVGRIKPSDGLIDRDLPS